MLSKGEQDRAEAIKEAMLAPVTKQASPDGILLCGHLRKLKQMKKKYFILFGETDDKPARLEYFESEKKWKSGHPAKRSIAIKSCFNINRRSDCKQKFVVSLYTSDECFSIAFDTEGELVKWLLVLLEIQLGGRVAEGEKPKPTFDHVWQVTVEDRELGAAKNMAGPYRLCLNSSLHTLALFRMPLSDPPEMFEFPIIRIRQCGQFGRRFVMEVGRGTATGAGELWMELEKSSTAHAIHWTLVNAMRDSASKHVNSRMRARCASVNDHQARSDAAGKSSTGQLRHSNSLTGAAIAFNAFAETSTSSSSPSSALSPSSTQLELFAI